MVGAARRARRPLERSRPRGTDHIVKDRQAFAWNPSGGGFKVEDTVLATDAGLEILSPDPEWPAIAVGGRQRPDVLA